MRAVVVAVAELGAIADVADGAAGRGEGAQAGAFARVRAGLDAGKGTTVGANSVVLAELDAQSGAPDLFIAGRARLTEIAATDGRLCAHTKAPIATSARTLFAAGTKGPAETAVIVAYEGIARNIRARAALVGCAFAQCA
jgi:hypothetical protein